MSTSPCCGGALTVTFSGSPYSTTEPVETPTTTQPEAEEDIAADPTNPGNLFAAISDFSSSAGYNNTKWALSQDGGTTWLENFVLSDPVSGQLLTSDNATWDANSDPVVAFDNSGNVYLSDLYLKLDSYGRIIAEGLYVGSGAFGNIGSTNFTSTYPVLTNLHNGNTFNIEDKPWIAVDKTGPSSSTNGYVYASWSHFTGCQNQYNALVGGYVLVCSSDSIYLSYSTDHGHTWLSTPITISPGSQDGAVQGSQPAVGPDGTVYVTYELMGSNNQRQQYLAVGTWSGGSLTFSTPFPASTVFNELDFAGCNTCTASYRVNSFPNIAVGPATAGNSAGNVYLVYGAKADSTSMAQVNFMACTASCTSSSAFYGPGIIDDDPTAPGEHFFPAIAVDSNGVIHTSWLDTRNGGNPTNPDALDVYASYLNQTGTHSFTASPNARITPTTNYANYNAAPGFNFGDTGFIGDYIGIAATPAGAGNSPPAKAYPAWTNVSGALGVPLYGFLQTRALPVP